MDKASKVFHKKNEKPVRLKHHRKPVRNFFKFKKSFKNTVRRNKDKIAYFDYKRKFKADAINKEKVHPAGTADTASTQKSRGESLANSAKIGFHSDGPTINDKDSSAGAGKAESKRVIETRRNNASRRVPKGGKSGGKSQKLLAHQERSETSGQSSSREYKKGNLKKNRFVAASELARQKQLERELAAKQHAEELEARLEKKKGILMRKSKEKKLRMKRNARGQMKMSLVIDSLLQKIQGS